MCIIWNWYFFIAFLFNLSDVTENTNKGLHLLGELAPQTVWWADEQCAHGSAHWNQHETSASQHDWQTSQAPGHLWRVWKMLNLKFSDLCSVDFLINIQWISYGHVFGIILCYNAHLKSLYHFYFSLTQQQKMTRVEWILDELKKR